MKQIVALEQWASIATELRETGYSLSQWQYDIDHPEGFHAWFWASGRPQISVMTRAYSVQEAIVRFKP